MRPTAALFRIIRSVGWFIPRGAAPGTRGNGIDLYNAYGTDIRENEVSYLRDGIYLENSRNTVVDQNKLFFYDMEFTVCISMDRLSPII
ncbi:NosD domain-containing protein [Paenibacillus sp. FSL H3-0321]|uniref:NosD domain-containing protein n=1 Tax=unclassified Paenibacillus TaxID=185978 RepID=UPI004046CCD1